MGKDSLHEGICTTIVHGSYKTQYNHKAEATRFVRQLRENGYGVTKWSNVDNKHVQSVVNSWKDNGLSDKTVKEYLSGVRAVAESFGNDKISSSNATFGLEKNTSGPKNQDLSCDQMKYEEAVKGLDNSNDINEQRLSVQMQYMRELGLRAEEARKLDAIHAERQESPNGQQYIHITDGTKGGKERWVPISGKAEKALNQGKELQRKHKTKNTMDPNKNERQWAQYAYNTASKKGFTASNRLNFHSLRHGFAHQLFEEKSGFQPRVKYSSRQDFEAAAQKSAGQGWKTKYETACRAVESALGHGTGRSDIRGAYIGR